MPNLKTKAILLLVPIVHGILLTDDDCGGNFFRSWRKKFTVSHLKRLFKALAMVTEIQSVTRYLLSAHQYQPHPQGACETQQLWLRNFLSILMGWRLFPPEQQCLHVIRASLKLSGSPSLAVRLDNRSGLPTFLFPLLKANFPNRI